MAALVAAIHVVRLPARCTRKHERGLSIAAFPRICRCTDVDARNKSGHDDFGESKRAELN
jgi:hypothetical protein